MIKKIIFGICILTILSSLTLAFGVSTPYYSDKPLVLKPGESRDVILTMQNMAGATDDLTVQAAVLSGGAVAEIIDQETIYEVPAGSDDIKTNLRVRMPNDANPGDKWGVEVDFKTINTKGGGMVSMGLGAAISFDVITSEAVKSEEAQPETKGSQNPFLWTTALVVLIIIIVIAVRAYRKRKK